MRRTATDVGHNAVQLDSSRDQSIDGDKQRSYVGLQPASIMFDNDYLLSYDEVVVNVETRLLRGMVKAKEIELDQV